VPLGGPRNPPAPRSVALIPGWARRTHTRHTNPLQKARLFHPIAEEHLGFPIIFSRGPVRRISALSRKPRLTEIQVQRGDRPALRPQEEADPCFVRVSSLCSWDFPLRKSSLTPTVLPFVPANLLSVPCGGLGSETCLDFHQFQDLLDRRTVPHLDPKPLPSAYRLAFLTSLIIVAGRVLRPIASTALSPKTKPIVKCFLSGIRKNRLRFLRRSLRTHPDLPP